MSERKSEKGLCRILVESADNDDFWPENESDAEYYEVISVDENDEDEESEESDEDYVQRRRLKRKIHYEHGYRYDQGFRGKLVCIRDQGSQCNISENRIILLRQLKSPTDPAGSNENGNCKTHTRPRAIVHANAQFETITNLRETNAGTSRSYGQMTEAMNQDNMREAYVDLQNQAHQSCNKSNCSSQTPITYIINNTLGQVQENQSKSVVNDLTNENRNSKLYQPQETKNIHTYTITSDDQAQDDENKTKLNVVPQQMSEDAMNVRLAAEALSLLKYRGRPIHQINEEPSSQQMENVPSSCKTQHYYKVGRSLDTSPKQNVYFKSNKTELRPITKKQQQKKLCVRMNSNLELTKATTGLKVPLRSILSKRNRNYLQPKKPKQPIQTKQPQKQKQRQKPQQYKQSQQRKQNNQHKQPQQHKQPNQQKQHKQSNQHEQAQHHTQHKQPQKQKQLQLQKQLPQQQQPKAKAKSSIPSKGRLTRKKLIKILTGDPNVDLSGEPINSICTIQPIVQSKKVPTDGSGQKGRPSSDSIKVGSKALNDNGFQRALATLQQGLGISMKVKIPLNDIILPKNAATGVRVFFKANPKRERPKLESSSKFNDSYSKKLRPEENPKKPKYRGVKTPLPKFSINKRDPRLFGKLFYKTLEDRKHTRLLLKPRIRDNKDMQNQHNFEEKKVHSYHCSQSSHFYSSSSHKTHVFKFDSAVANGGGSVGNSFNYHTPSHDIKYSTHPQPIQFGFKNPYAHLSASQKMYNSDELSNNFKPAMHEKVQPTQLQILKSPTPHTYEQEAPPGSPMVPKIVKLSPNIFVVSTGTVIRETTTVLHKTEENFQRSYSYPQIKNDREDESFQQTPIMSPAIKKLPIVIKTLDVLGNDSKANSGVPHLKQIDSMWTTKHNQSDSTLPQSTYITKSVITSLNTTGPVSQDEGICVQQNQPFYVLCNDPITPPSVITPPNSANLFTNEFNRDGKTFSHFQQIEESPMPQIGPTAYPASSTPQIGPMSPTPAMQPAPTMSPNAPHNFISSVDGHSFIKKLKINQASLAEIDNCGPEPVQPSAKTADDTITVKTPLHAFSLLINDDMIERIIKYTNENLERQVAIVKNRNFRMPTTQTELKAFLGLLLISGALRQNNISVPEIWSECFGAGIYRATLQETRFQILSQSICFGDSMSRDTCILKDEFTRKGALWKDYCNNCKKYSLPLSQVTEINECSKGGYVGIGGDETGHFYSTVRKTVNMPLRILLSMLDGAGIRGLAMFRRANPNVKICHRDFLKQVGMNLVLPQLRKRVQNKGIKQSTKELIESILNRKNENEVKSSTTLSLENNWMDDKWCQLCSFDRNVRFQCENCQKAVCTKHHTTICSHCVNGLM